MTNSFFVCFHSAAKPTKAQGKEIQNINTTSVMYLYLKKYFKYFKKSQSAILVINICDI